MTERWLGALLGAAFIFAAPLAIPTAEARARPRPEAAQTQKAARHKLATHASVRAIRAGMASTRLHNARHARVVARYRHSGSQGGGLQCVPFARENSGIELTGNAVTWWDNAEGIYERGARPEVGSVLNFRATGRMRLGHVAVVAKVVDSRTIEIDHANWAGPGGAKGRVSRNVDVVDVSARNDWSAVRVALGHTGNFGSVYPTYGFIYDRADQGTMVANATTTPAPVLNAAPRDLRPAADRLAGGTAIEQVEEVAEAADIVRPRAVRPHRVVRHARTTLVKTSVIRPGKRHVVHAAPHPAKRHRR